MLVEWLGWFYTTILFIFIGLEKEKGKMINLMGEMKLSS